MQFFDSRAVKNVTKLFDFFSSAFPFSDAVASIEVAHDAAEKGAGAAYHHPENDPLLVAQDPALGLVGRLLAAVVVQSEHSLRHPLLR